MSLRAKKAIDKMAANGGRVRPALVDVGYSPDYAKSNKFKATKAYKNYQEYISKRFSHDKVGDKHKELLDQKAVSYFVFPRKMPDDEIVAHVKAAGIDVITVRESDKGKMAFYSIADTQALKGGLEMIYKIRGDYAAEKHIIEDELGKLSDEELRERKKALIAKLKKR